MAIQQIQQHIQVHVNVPLLCHGPFHILDALVRCQAAAALVSHGVQHCQGDVKRRPMHASHLKADLDGVRGRATRSWLPENNFPPSFPLAQALNCDESVTKSHRTRCMEMFRDVSRSWAH
ncbi:hypothetical protein WJX77_010468 [Trebouxia sp. C0004]